MNRKEFIIGATAAGLAPTLSAAGKDGLRLRFLGTGACGGSAFTNCAFAYNLTQGKNSPGGLNVVKGDATVRNTVFFGNVRGYKDASIATGYDIDVKTDGTATVRHSSVTSREDGSKCALDAGLDMDKTVKDWTRKRYGNSPAIDAGDPAVKCVEPHPNGRRVNLGFYGNTPWATMSDTGLLLFVR